MNQQTTLFSNEKLMAMIIPLFLEQLLIMLVGMADTLVVSYAGRSGSIRCFTGKSVQYYFYLSVYSIGIWRGGCDQPVYW